MNFYWIYDLPTWQLGLVIVGGFTGVSLLGLAVSRRAIYSHYRLSTDTNESVNGIFAGVGVLYGLLLGLVAVAVWENFEMGEGLVAKEASAIAALYRDVSTLSEPTRSSLQQDINDYLHFVIEQAWPAHRRGETPNGGTLVLSEFLGTLSRYHPVSTEQEVFLAEVFEAYNKLIEARRLRLSAVDSGVPAVFWVVIILGGILNIFITYFFHLPLLRTHLVMTGLFSVFLGLMIFLIAAVDNPFRGEVSIQPDAYAAILRGLKDLKPR